MEAQQPNGIWLVFCPHNHWRWGNGIAEISETIEKKLIE